MLFIPAGERKYQLPCWLHTDNDRTVGWLWINYLITGEYQSGPAPHFNDPFHQDKMMPFSVFPSCFYSYTRIPKKCSGRPEVFSRVLTNTHLLPNHSRVCRSHPGGDLSVPGSFFPWIIQPGSKTSKGQEDLPSSTGTRCMSHAGHWLQPRHVQLVMPRNLKFAGYAQMSIGSRPSTLCKVPVVTSDAFCRLICKAWAC